MNSRCSKYAPFSISMAMTFEVNATIIAGTYRQRSQRGSTGDGTGITKNVLHKRLQLKIEGLVHTRCDGKL